MTDLSLMEADCTHGRTWYDCPECDELMADDLARVNAPQVVESDGDW